MPTKVLAIVCVAVLGLALFACGKIMEEPGRNVAPGQASAPAPAMSALQWNLGEPAERPALANASDAPQATLGANQAGVWATPAEWSQSD